jgi:hypothetical protein
MNTNRISTALFVACVGLTSVSTEAHAQASPSGHHKGKGIAGHHKGKGIAGTGMAAASIAKFKQHKDNPSQVTGKKTSSKRGAKSQ